MSREDAPLYDALISASKMDAARFHMPGHKQRPLPGKLLDAAAAIDVTELSYSGNLYTERSGPIRDAESALAGLYNAHSAMLLTGGASQGVLSMLAACTSPGDKLLVHRNAHRSVFNAMGLLDLHPCYITEDTVSPFHIGGGVSLGRVDAGLEEHPEIRAFIITSPNYYGVLSDIASIAAVCKRRGVKLLVDAAHGAHVQFTGAADNPVSEGADIAVFSAHKTLPALGQSAFLLAAQSVDSDKLRHFTAVFGTSSPSYLIMASMDLARADLAVSGRRRWLAAASFGSYLRSKYSNVLSNGHLTLGRADLCRICLYTGDGYGDALRMERDYGIFCEMADLYNIVLILSPSDHPEWHERLDNAIAALPERGEAPAPPEAPAPEAALSPREAMFSATERLPLRKCAGYISACPIAPYPPGIPIIAPGEKIDKKHIEILRKLCYNMDEDTFVVKQ